MRSRIRSLCLSVALAGIGCLATVLAGGEEPAPKPVAADAPAVSFVKDVQPLLAKYCSECHGAEKPKGGLALAAFRDERGALARRDVWQRVAENLSAEAMPPEGKPQPEQNERGLILRWIESRVLKVDCTRIDPGRVTIRRLNRTEYNNTVRDLLGVDIHPADDFPSDDVGYGFDHIGDVLSMPPVLLERYLAAAERIVEAAIFTSDPDRAPVEARNGQTLASVGDAEREFEFSRDGDYLLRIRAWAQQAGPEKARMTLKLDGKDLTTVEVDAVEGAAK